jgi:Aerobic-type carbon monoxide dehydrogenase, large subunit CoxL/CutL homologs
VMKDGTLVARQVTANFNTGAYSDIGPVVARNGGSAMSGPYKIPHVRIDSFAVWSNVVPAGALRGFGVPQAVWGTKLKWTRSPSVSVSIRWNSAGKICCGTATCSPPAKH